MLLILRLTKVARSNRERALLSQPASPLTWRSSALASCSIQMGLVILEVVWEGSRGAGERQQNKLNQRGMCPHSHLVLQCMRLQTGARDTIWSHTDTKTSIWTVIFCFMGLQQKKNVALARREPSFGRVSICSPIKCLESFLIHTLKKEEVHKQLVFFLDQQGVRRLPSTIMF